MRLFCYGTLLFPEIMYRVSGTRFEGVEAVLEDHACYVLKRRPFPGMIPERGGVTAGVVYTGIGTRHLQRLDAYEGELYVRRRVCVSSREGRPLQAWTYLVAPARRALLSGTRWRRAAFEQQHLRHYLHTCPAAE